MTMEVAAALRRGFDMVASRTGLAFMGLFLLLELLFTGIPSMMFDTAVATSNTFALGVGVVIGLILSLALTVVAFRAFVPYDPANPQQGYDTDRLATATAHMVAGEITAAVIIGVGFLLIIPGLFLLVSLLFWPVFVAVEREDFVDAFRSSWRLTNGHRWETLFLVIGILVVILAVNAVAALFSVIAPGNVVPTLLLSVSNAFTAVFAITAIADAYTQMTA